MWARCDTRKICSSTPLLISLVVFTGLHSEVEAATCSKFIDVVCSGVDGILGKSATLSDGRRISCKVEPLGNATGCDAISTTGLELESAGPADFLNISCYQFFSKLLFTHKAVLSLSWGYQENLILGGLVQAYNLQFDMVSRCASLTIKGEAKADETVVNAQGRCIKFLYNGYGEAEYLDPGSTMDIRVQPVPESKRGESSNLLRKEYTVPDVSRCWIPNTGTTGAQTDNHTPTMYHDHDSSHIKQPVSSNTMTYWLIAILVFIATAILVGTIYKVLKRHKMAEDKEKTRLLGAGQILILANIKDPEDCNEGHMIATSIRNFSDNEVVCNFENKKVIVYQQDSVTWHYRHCLKADTIIFINATKALRQIDDTSLCHSESSEFESFINSFFEDVKIRGKRVIFIEDDDVNIGCHIECYPFKNYPRFLYKDSYDNKDAFFKELFA